MEREFYFVVVVTQFQSPDTVEATVGKIIVASLRFPVINVVVVVQTTDGTVVLYAYSLFTTNCTIGLTLLEINQFDPVTGEPLQPMTYLYPVRQGHLGNCVLNVTANHMPPHFIYEKWTEERNSYPENQVVDPKDVSGIDWEVLQLLSKALKFKIQLLLPSEPSQIFGEGNVTGSFAQVGPIFWAVRICSKDTLSAGRRKCPAGSWWTERIGQAKVALFQVHGLLSEPVCDGRSSGSVLGPLRTPHAALSGQGVDHDYPDLRHRLCGHLRPELTFAIAVFLGESVSCRHSYPDYPVFKSQLYNLPFR